MDGRTLHVYEKEAARLAERHRSAEPTRIHNLIRAFFHSGGATADVGCGSGRDTQWLRVQGFPVIGFDGSEGMLREAQAAYPEITVSHATLPDLTSVPDHAFHNVLCSAVLMHLKREDLITAALSLSRFLRPEGRLILSYRSAREGGEREADGRLFTPIPLGKLTLLLESAGLRVLLSEETPDVTRPGVTWKTLVAEKGPLEVARGLDRVQTVLAQDAKTATYKLALVRALCEIGRTESHKAVWSGGEVFIPMRSVAVRWLVYYWPLLASPAFIAQKRGERPEDPKPVAFRRTVWELADRFRAGGLWALIQDLETHPSRYDEALRKIAQTVRVGPVQYAGGGGWPIFRYESRAPHPSDSSGSQRSLGWVVVPEPVWLDLTRFDHWIEDSVVVRWARLTAEMNPGTTMAEYLPLLLSTPGDERNTQEVRELLRSLGEPVECVWTGEPVRDLQIDHVIPYSVWGNNDLWNLLPCRASVNLQKRDALPSVALIQSRAPSIIENWRRYQELRGQQFATQLSRALGADPERERWEATALAGLAEVVQRLSVSRGIGLWEPH